jgi:hypothetical protein
MIDVIRNLSCNFGGKTLKKKVVVIESDDWGSIRMPSFDAFEELIKLGIPVEKSVYGKYDGLEKDSDILSLLETCDRIERKYHKRPVLTLNFVTSNPDFQRIANSEFESYFSEEITNTYKLYSQSSSVMEHVKLGMEKGFFHPQFHGREHVNVPYWIELIKTNEKFKRAFELGLFGLSNDVFPELKRSVQATYDTLDKNYQNESLSSGLKIFENIFGYTSRSFISNNYILSESSFQTLVDHGVRVLQGMKFQKLPLEEGQSNRKMIRRRFGDIDEKSGLKFGVRNCTFEPTELNDTIEKTLHQIRLAFLMKKPAVISTHRINYTSRMSDSNRTKNLIAFEQLIARIIEIWPDVEFSTNAKTLCVDN